MQRGRYFPYRTTLDKLADHAEQLQDEGEAIVSFHHVGGRDWVIIARKGGEPEDDRLRAEVSHLRAELRDLAVSAKRYMQAVDVARGVAR